MLFYSILRHFATKARENANLKKEEFLFFSKNKKRRTTKKEKMVTYEWNIPSQNHCSMRLVLLRKIDKLSCVCMWKKLNRTHLCAISQKVCAGGFFSWLCKEKIQYSYAQKIQHKKLHQIKKVNVLSFW